MNPGWLYVMEYLVYHLRPFGLDIPFEKEMMQGDGTQLELLGQMVLDDAKKMAEKMMGKDDLAWRRREPTMGPQIITKKPATMTIASTKIMTNSTKIIRMTNSSTTIKTLP